MEFLIFYVILCWVLETRHENKIDHVFLSVSLNAQMHRNRKSSSVLTYVAIMKKRKCFVYVRRIYDQYDASKNKN